MTVGVRLNAAFWLGLALVGFVLVWLLRDALLPFVAAVVLAYLLNPLANRLERLGVSRTWATLIILLVFVVVLTTTIVLLAPILGNQLLAFLRALPGYATQLHGFVVAQLSEIDDNPVARYLLERLGTSGQEPGPLVSQAAAWAGSVLNQVWSHGQTLVGVLSLVVLTPIIAFYILVDWPRMIGAVDGWLPRRQAPTIRGLAREIDRVVAGFLRGQASVCLALALFYGISLTATGLNFGLLIGVAAGILSFVPYVGSIVGFVTAIGVALVQFSPDWTAIAIVAGVFAAGQILEGYVLQPKLVGGSVGLHPVWLMFALVAFGSLLGFVGLLIAVPLAAAIGVLLRFALRRYQASPFYTGDTGPPQGDGI
jgi:predicted PurR-regulated permease PerM